MMRPALARAAGLFVALAFVVGSSCDVSYTDCAIACAENGDCPSDLRCKNGFCSSGPACDGMVGAGSGGEAGASGQGGYSGSVGDDGTGGSAPTGGRMTSGGEGGEGAGQGGASQGGASTGGQRDDGGASGTGGAGEGGGGPWTPRELPGLALWLDAEAGLETTGAPPTSLVHTWRDQSGNANDAFQSNAVMRPRFDGAAANGRPALDFGSAPISYMSIADSATMRAGNQNYTLEIVTAWVNSTVPTAAYSGYALIFSKQIQTYPYTGVGVYANEGVNFQPRLWLIADGEHYALSSETNLNDNTFRLCAARRVGASGSAPGEIEIRVNGSSSARLSLPVPIDLSASGEPATIGGQRGEIYQALNGFVAEIVFVIGDLPDDDLDRLERYLNEKYSLWQR